MSLLCEFLLLIFTDKSFFSKQFARKRVVSNEEGEGQRGAPKDKVVSITAVTSTDEDVLSRTEDHPENEDARTRGSSARIDTSSSVEVTAAMETEATLSSDRGACPPSLQGRGEGKVAFIL